jgi:hypothetical protein
MTDSMGIDGSWYPYGNINHDYNKFITFGKRYNKKQQTHNRIGKNMKKSISSWNFFILLGIKKCACEIYMKEFACGIG